MASREAFEAWYGSKPEQDEHGNYTLPLPQARWEVWQARQAEIDARDAEMSRLMECLTSVPPDTSAVELVRELRDSHWLMMDCVKKVHPDLDLSLHEALTVKSDEWLEGK